MFTPGCKGLRLRNVDNLIGPFFVLNKNTPGWGEYFCFKTCQRFISAQTCHVDEDMDGRNEARKRRAVLEGWLVRRKQVSTLLL